MNQSAGLTVFLLGIACGLVMSIPVMTNQWINARSEKFKNQENTQVVNVLVPSPGNISIDTFLARGKIIRVNFITITNLQNVFPTYNINVQINGEKSKNYITDGFKYYEHPSMIEIPSLSDVIPIIDQIVRRYKYNVMTPEQYSEK